MGWQSYKKRLWKSAKEAYKKCDVYAKDLTLTFNGEDKHTTYVGATMTIGIMIFMGVYALLQLEVMFKRERTTVNVKSAYEDLTLHYENYSLTDFGFDMAVQVSAWGEHEINTRKFNLEFINTNSWWETDSSGVARRFKEKNYMDLKICDDFNGSEEEIARLGINQTYY